MKKFSIFRNKHGKPFRFIEDVWKFAGHFLQYALLTQNCAYKQVTTGELVQLQPMGALSAQGFAVLSKFLQVSLYPSLAAHSRNTWKPAEEELEER